MFDVAGVCNKEKIGETTTYVKEAQAEGSIKGGETADTHLRQKKQTGAPPQGDAPVMKV
jgi:hypothetical protein